MINGWNLLILNISGNIEIFLLIAFFCLLFYYKVGYKFGIRTVFDPFAFSLFGSSMGTAAVVFMYFYDLLYYDWFALSYIATESAYLTGLLFFTAQKQKDNCIKYEDNQILINYTYYFFSMIFLVNELYGMLTMGIPVFSGVSRLEFYRDGSGIISLIKRNTSFVVIFFLIDRWLKGKKSIFAKLFDYVVMTFLFLSMIGTGAKSAFLIIVYTIFFYRLRLKCFIVDQYYILRLNQLIKKMSIIALIVACIVLSIEMNTANIDVVLLNLGIRLVAFGDIFAYFYGDDFFSLIRIDNFFYEVFGPVFAMIRVVNYSDVPENVGLQLWQMLNNYLEVRGPNPRHNIFGYLHFGIIGSSIYSFIIGVCASYVRNRLFPRMASNLFLLFVYIQLYMFSTGFAGDISTTLVYFWSFLLIDGSFFCFIYVFYRVMTKRKEC